MIATPMAICRRQHRGEDLRQRRRGRPRYRCGNPAGLGQRPPFGPQRRPLGPRAVLRSATGIEAAGPPPCPRGDPRLARPSFDRTSDAARGQRAYGVQELQPPRAFRPGLFTRAMPSRSNSAATPLHRCPAEAIRYGNRAAAPRAVRRAGLRTTTACPARGPGWPWAMKAARSPTLPSTMQAECL